MSLRNDTSSFGSIARFFHWTVALFIICTIPLGFFMQDLTHPTLQGFLYNLHKSIGLTVLLLVILRYLWRLLNPPPKFPAGTPVWQAIAAKWSHTIIYLLLFIIPISGWVMSTASQHAPNVWWLYKLPTPGITINATVASITHTIHIYGAWLLTGLLCLHILAALEHWIIRRDDVMQRMWPKFLKKKNFYDSD